MAQPLTYPWKQGREIDFTKERKGRLASGQGDKVAQCPHCKRMGMRRDCLDGKVRYSHVSVITDLGLQAKDACAMWPRAEFKLQYGYDGIHPKFRRPGDEDTSVEELRQQAQ